MAAASLHRGPQEGHTAPLAGGPRAADLATYVTPPSPSVVGNSKAWVSDLQCQGPCHRGRQLWAGRVGEDAREVMKVPPRLWKERLEERRVLLSQCECKSAAQTPCPPLCFTNTKAQGDDKDKPAFELLFGAPSPGDGLLPDAAPSPLRGGRTWCLHVLITRGPELPG